MNIVVPLAGPDFILSNGSVKALIDLDGEPLLTRALNSRSWAKSVDSGNMHFVLKKHEVTERFAEDYLSKWYPGCKTVFISDYTRGAALSCIAGLSMLQAPDAPLILDLADILYCENTDPVAMFRDRTDLGGIALTFESSEPVYSYLRRDSDGRVVEAAEKRVISNEASAGTYMFRNLATYLRAVAHSLDNAEAVTFRNLFFVCPVFNGVIDQGLRVETVEVSDVRDIKTA